MAIAYSTFANGGYKVSAYTIDRIEDAGGKVLMQAAPALACFECGRVTAAPLPKVAAAAASVHAEAPAAQLDEATHDGKTLIPVKNLAPQILKPQIAYLLADMMADVIKRGTGVRARSLNRDDIAGKTGTSNDQHDAWFNGFNGDLVTSVWTGFDQDRIARARGGRRPRGGAHLDLFHARGAGAARPATGSRCPTASSRCASRRQTGLLASSDNPNGIMEKFIEGSLPKAEAYEGPKSTRTR